VVEAKRWIEREIMAGSGPQPVRCAKGEPSPDEDRDRE
jgi:hypothetical protein